MYEIIWDKKAINELKKLETIISIRIIRRIREFREDPFKGDIKKLKKEEGYRLRIGDYRVIFDVKDKKVVILKIGHRRNVY